MSERATEARECMVCHGGGRGPGDDSVRCWACDGRGYLRPGVPSDHGLFIDWLFRRDAERDALQAELAETKAGLRDYVEAFMQKRDALAEAQQALRLLQKERARGLNVVPLLKETCDFLDALAAAGAGESSKSKLLSEPAGENT